MVFSSTVLMLSMPREAILSIITETAGTNTSGLFIKRFAVIFSAHSHTDHASRTHSETAFECDSTRLTVPAQRYNDRVSSDAQ